MIRWEAAEGKENGEIENKGIPPDIEVAITPKDVTAGRDPHLERGVEEALRMLKEHPVKFLKEPPPPVRKRPQGE